MAAFDWNDWLSIGSMGVAILSAIFTGLTLLYTRRQTINDNLRMKRKAITWEFGERQSRKFEPWSFHFLVVRNHEPCAARVIGARAKSRQGLMILADDAEIRENSYSEPTGLDITKARREILIDRHVQPLGHVTGVPGRGPVPHIGIYVQNISAAKEIDLDWEWADGTPI